jgi:hypothetical protein
MERLRQKDCELKAREILSQKTNNHKQENNPPHTPKHNRKIE